MKLRVCNWLSAMFLFVCIGACVLWWRSAHSIFDMVEWSNGDGTGGLIESGNGELDWYAPDVGNEEKYVRWRVLRLMNPPVTFPTTFSLRCSRSDQGHFQFDLVIPWWWVVLGALVPPTIRMRAFLQRKAQPQEVRARFAGRIAAALTLLVVVIVNFVPTTQSTIVTPPPPPGYDGGWNVLAFAEETRYGWPFVVRTRAEIDEKGTASVGWFSGGIASNVIVAALLALAAGGCVKFAVARHVQIVAGSRLQRGLCRTCSYNLTGNTSGMCPECGTTIAMKACIASHRNALVGNRWHKVFN